MTAVGAGTATITATSEGKNGTAAITVAKNRRRVSGEDDLPASRPRLSG